jgi:hypothetical protein
MMLGYIADEIGAVFPGLVKRGTRADGKRKVEYESVATSLLVPMLHTAVIDLADAIDLHEARLADLESTAASLAAAIVTA